MTSMLQGQETSSYRMRSPRTRRRVALLVVVLVVCLGVPASVIYVSGWWTRWQPVLDEDFEVSVPTGAFARSPYAETWEVYPDGWKDTSGVGTYAPTRVLSVQDGSLRWDLRAEGGDYLGAAVVARPTFGQVYGRFSVRWRADPVTGYGLAFLLWPDSEEWPDDGEIDFPEGALDGEILAAAHHADPAGGQDVFETGTSMQDWHTAVIDWRPSSVSFVLDGEEIGRSSTRVPSTPMHFVMQIGTAGDEEPPPDARGAVEVDWVRVEAFGG